MKTIGIVGGLGPESTLDYYKGIIKAFDQTGGTYEYPEIFIHSLNLGRALEMFETGDWQGVARMLLTSISSLQAAGAQFAAIASNTPHLVFDQVSRAAPLPLISIVEAACGQARSLGLARPGLLGTRVTMGSDLYQRVFEKHGMEVTVPGQADQDLIQSRLFSEIEKGIITNATRRELLDIVARMKDSQGIDGVILGCTELPLILDQDSLELPFLNTSAIHVRAIVEYCRREE